MREPAATRRARWPERVALRDGSQVAIRPIRATDKARLREGFERFSTESRQRRFLVADNDEALELFEELGAAHVVPTGSGLVEAQVDLPTTDDGRLSALLRAAAARRLLVRPPAPRQDASPDR